MPANESLVMPVVDQVRELVAPIVCDAGADLYDVEFNGSVLRVLVDRQGGIDVGAISSISRRAGRVLDELDAVPGRYTLEVSSPGLERPLRRPEHYARALGEQLTLKTRDEIDGKKRFEGELTASDEGGIEILTSQGALSLAYDQIAKARTVFAWGPAAKRPGRNSSRPEPSRPEPSRPEPSRPEPSRTQPGRPDANRSDESRSKESES